MPGTQIWKMLNKWYNRNPNPEPQPGTLTQNQNPDNMLNTLKVL